MKKILAVLICAIMVTSMAFTAMAETKNSYLGSGAKKSEGTGTQTEENAGEDVDISEILGGLLDGEQETEDGESRGTSGLLELFGGIASKVSDFLDEAGIDTSEDLPGIAAQVQEGIGSFLESLGESKDELKEKFGDFLHTISDVADDAADKIDNGEDLFDSFEGISSGETAEESEPIHILGGWKVNTEFTGEGLEDQAFDAWKKAFPEGEDAVGNQLLPVANLATQVVAGTNYAFLCQGSPAQFNAPDAWYIAKVCVNLRGDVANTSLEEIELDDIEIADDDDDFALGGWTVPEKADDDYAVLPEDAQNVFDQAMEKVVGVNYKPIVLLGTQLVAGTNYKFLCYGTTVTAEPQTAIYVVDIYANLTGEAELTNIASLDLVDYLDD